MLPGGGGDREFLDTLGSQCLYGPSMQVIASIGQRWHAVINLRSK